MEAEKFLNRILNDTDSSQGRMFTYTIKALIIISLVDFPISTLPDLPSSLIEILALLEVMTVVIFTVEYLGRLYVAERKIGFVFSFFGVIDLLAVLPFYLALECDLRSLRIFWLLRLLRILKLLKYNAAINRFHRALVISKEELLFFGFVVVIMLYLSAVGIYFFENAVQPEKFTSVFHSLWWAVTTLTTVGYGDMFPVTLGGRMFTFLVLMVGLGIVAVPTGLITSALVQAREEERIQKK